MYIVHNSPILEEKLLISPTTQHKPISSTISAESGVNSESSLNAHPVVQLHIDGAILFNLLTYIFPVPPVLPSTVEQVMELLSVAQMYKMDVVVTYIRNYIAQQEPPLILEETAFLIHSLSQKQALRHEALQAARCALSFTIFTFPDLEKKLDMMPGALLYELWKYRERIRSNLASDLRKFKRSDAARDTRRIKMWLGIVHRKYPFMAPKPHFHHRNRSRLLFRSHRLLYGLRRSPPT